MPYIHIGHLRLQPTLGGMLNIVRPSLGLGCGQAVALCATPTAQHDSTAHTLLCCCCNVCIVYARVDSRMQQGRFSPYCKHCALNPHTHVSLSAKCRRSRI